VSQQVGGDIALPGNDSKDKSLDTVLGVLRILEEFEFENEWPKKLPWLADDSSDAGTRFRTWKLSQAIWLP
jgi:hypothetical protein